MIGATRPAFSGEGLVMLARFLSGSVIRTLGVIIGGSMLTIWSAAPVQAQHGGHAGGGHAAGGHMGGAGGAHHSGGAMSGGAHHAGGSMSGGTHHSGSYSGSHHHGGSSYYGGFGGIGIGGFSSPYGLGYSNYGLGYSNYGLGNSNYGRSYSNYGLGYSNYGYSAQPYYSAPVYNYSTSRASAYQQPTQYSNSGYSTGYSTVASPTPRVTLNPDGTPSGELRPGMVLPDGAIVVSVGASTP